MLTFFTLGDLYKTFILQLLLGYLEHPLNEFSFVLGAEICSTRGSKASMRTILGHRSLMGRVEIFLEPSKHGATRGIFFHQKRVLGCPRKLVNG